jgi:hypothetical protein
MISKEKLLFVAILFLLILLQGVWVHSVQAQNLVQPTSLVYVGTFKVPHNNFPSNCSVCLFEYGGGVLTYNPAGNGGAGSLYMTGNAQGQMTAEISIPTPVNSTNLADLNTATVLQNFVEAMEGGCGNVVPTVGSRNVGGQMVANNRLYVTCYVYYDGNGEQTQSHFIRPLNLSTTGQVQGAYTVASPGSAGFVDGWMGPIPSAYQSSLGGPFFTGNCCLSIISRTSYGPAAFSFDVAKLGVQSPVPSTPLIYYTGAHPTLGNWNSTSPYFNGTTQMGGATIPVNTRSMLFFGRHGTGAFCYGPGTSDPNLAGQIDPTTNDTWCYDPTDGSKGTHAYPYRLQVWAYDLNDLAAVKAGTKNPWDPIPYAVWTLNFPLNAGNVRAGGVAYDPVNQKLYVVQPFADQAPGNIWATYPVIHVFSVQAAGAPPPTPPTPPNNLTIQ